MIHLTGLVFAIHMSTATPPANDIIVDRRGPVSTVTEGIRLARPGDRIIVRSGSYDEPVIVVRTPRLTISGDGWPVLDGGNSHQILVIEADSVTVRGLVLQRTGASNLEDRAAIRVRNATACLVENNRLRETTFGIYLERTSHCTVRDNDLVANEASQTSGGNGIHLWNSTYARVERNRVRGHRDGIYFEFSPHGMTSDNVSSRNKRYGLHFMFSDSCRYDGNRFHDNVSGVAVMYSRGVTIVRNTFSRATGGAAYGLLIKEILGGEIGGNRFLDNSTALYLEGSSRLLIRDNDFIGNAWAARVLGGAIDNVFTGNLFAANAFDVTTNSRESNSTFAGNWWDAYRGYDLDHDGFGDVPFRPVRLFALVVEQHHESIALLRSPLASLLDIAERLLPVLTPATLADPHPLMRSPR
jgi:nitrous oxidase accessory protein